MSRDKQIEEMAKIICRINRDGICDYDGQPCDFDCGSYQLATIFYNAGYRKASDVAEEIFAEIEKETNTYEVPFSNGEIKGLIVMAIDKEDYNSIKNKYIGKDTNVTTKESEKDNG